jgi:hypothetical protein
VALPSKRWTSLKLPGREVELWVSIPLSWVRINNKSESAVKCIANSMSCAYTAIVLTETDFMVKLHSNVKFTV